MAAEITPTVTARSPEEYKQQMEQVAGFAKRIHLDVADGIFTPVKLTPLDQLWWPANIFVDVHVMYKDPFKHTKLIIDLAPQLVIVHAEADGDFVEFAEAAHAHGIQVGVALKPETMPQVIEPALPWIDHVLIFSGDLGRFGGQANTHLLTKVLYLKQRKPSLEIGWDGGVNNQNAHVLAAGGVDVLNTGGFIHHAANPRAAYETLQRLSESAPVPRQRFVQ
jgi:ribulose-phosphate 3-epimerase